LFGKRADRFLDSHCIIGNEGFGKNLPACLSRSLFQRLATTSLAAPSPPTWSYVLFGDHPTIVQRIAMAQAFERRRP